MGSLENELLDKIVQLVSLSAHKDIAFSEAKAIRNRALHEIAEYHNAAIGQAEKVCEEVIVAEETHEQCTGCGVTIFCWNWPLCRDCKAHNAAIEQVARRIEELQESYGGDCVGNLLVHLPDDIRELKKEVGGE